MTDPATIAIPVARLREVATDACLACGASQALAASLVEASLAADLAGRPNIGLAHMLDYLNGMREGRIDPQAHPVIDQPLPAIIRVDGQRGIAQLGFDQCFDRLVTAAHTFGIALFAQRNTFTAGELGYFPRRLARAGLLALAVANSHAMMATAPGREVSYGTNPMAFAAPRRAPHPPLLFDQAASATAFVNIRRAAAVGQTIPAGWAIDADGAATTDPARAVLGALLPFGGAKGANIALMVEVLSAGLAGGAWSLDAGHFSEGSESPRSGLTVIAIAPAAIDPAFAERLEAQIARLAARGVHIPGASAPCDGSGEITIARDTLDAISEFARAAQDHGGQR